MKWQPMPDTYGPHWFCKELEDRDLSDFVRVRRIETPSEVYFERSYGVRIQPGEGWWLLIPDHRKTAELPRGAST